MQLYFNLINQTFIPFFNLSYLLFLSSFLYLLYKKHLFAYITMFLFITILTTGTGSEAYYQQLMPFIIICVGIFLSHLLISKKLIIIFFAIFLASCILNLESHHYGLTLNDKINLVKKVGYYPEKFSVIAPGMEFPSILDPYKYLFWYYYHEVVPNTSITINESICCKP